jgi:hypothetical protein
MYGQAAASGVSWFYSIQFSVRVEFSRLMREFGAQRSISKLSSGDSKLIGRLRASTKDRRKSFCARSSTSKEISGAS